MKKVSKTLNGHLAKVTELVSRIENRDGGAPQIEIDMLLAALREMYDAVYSLLDEENEFEPEQVAPVAETVAEKPEEKAEPAVVETEVAPSVLMVDTEAEAVFADDPAEEAVASYDTNQPSMEELEGQPNDELFEEQPEEEPVVEAQPAEEPKQETVEQPKTLWDKLQDTQAATTIADKIGTSKSISDLMEEKTAHKQEEPEKEPAVEEASPAEEPVVEEQPVEEPSQPTEEVAQEPKPAQPSLFDYFKTAAPEKPATRTIADTLGGTGDSVEQKVSGSKVHDLRTIININDKFSFMNELFHNNMKGYNDFILRLNAIDDREEALAYVSTIAEQYAWDNESLAVKTFYSIFDRKF